MCHHRRIAWVVGCFIAMLFVNLSIASAAGGTFPVTNGKEFKKLRAQLQAVQFLSRATFGYTESDIDLTDANSLASRILAIGQVKALREWINKQCELPATLVEDRAEEMMFADGWDQNGNGIWEYDPNNSQNPVNDFANRPSLPFPIRVVRYYRDFGWWDVAINADDQLRQRMAWALSQICVTNERVGVFSGFNIDASGKPRFLGVCDYYDIFVEKGLDDYRSVLHDVTYHPVMGNFLTHINSTFPNADENYARESLQLFTTGELKLKQNGEFAKDTNGDFIQVYTNEDILALSDVLTGLKYAGNKTDLHSPMEMFPARHDWDGKDMPNLGITVPAGTEQTAEAANAEIKSVYDQIYAHPNVGPFIARQLIQRFVMSNPSKGYIRRVASVFNDDGTGTKGNLKAVITAILTDRQALRTQRYVRVRSRVKVGNRYRLRLTGLRVITRGTEHSRLEEPVIQMARFFKLYGTPIKLPAQTGEGYRIYPSSLDTNQLPFKAPSVFSFYRPDHFAPGFQDYTPSKWIPNGELHGPEFQIFTPVVANRLPNMFRRHIHWDQDYNTVDLREVSNAFAKEAKLAGGTTVAELIPLMERLNLLLCHGSMSDDSEEIIAKAIVDSGGTNFERAGSAVQAVLTASEYVIRD